MNPQLDSPRRLGVILLVLCLLAACAGVTTPTSTPAAPMLSSTPDATAAPTPAPTPAQTVILTAKPRPTGGLVPTGIDVLTPDNGRYSSAVVDGEGVIWAKSATRLVRFDPATDSTRTWSISDDAAFGAPGVAAARDGGVWLFSQQTLRRFDGERLTAMPDPPDAIIDVVEAPDGTVWATSPSDEPILHWDGATWSSLRVDLPQPYAWVAAMAVADAGQVWIGWGSTQPYPPDLARISRYDGSSWTTFDDSDANALVGEARSIATLPGGAIWVATSTGLARFDGSAWADHSAVLSLHGQVASVAAGPGDSVWVGLLDAFDGAFTVGRFGGGSWSFEGAGPGPFEVSEGGLPNIGLLPTRDGTYVRTDLGIFGLAGDRWEPAWSSTASLSLSDPLLAVSRDELWAGGEGGPWHFLDGAWTSEPVGDSDPLLTRPALSYGPDGTVWAAGSHGVAYYLAGRWTVVDDEDRATAVFADGTGTVWAAGTSGCDLWKMHLNGALWTRDAVTGCPLAGLGYLWSFGSDAPDSLWVAQSGGWVKGGLAHFDGQAWEEFDKVGDSAIYGAEVLGTASDGTVWVVLQYLIGPPDDPSVRFQVAGFDGSGWLFVELPDGGLGTKPWVAADGTLWANSDRGPARLDGQRWTYPYEGTAGIGFAVFSAAPDGTLFALSDEGNPYRDVVRFPASAP